MRKILFLTCFLAGMLVACDSDDDSGDNHVVADFQLQNEKGVECYDFQEGDNIIFKLEIRNDGDEEIILPPISEVIGFDIFRVYTKNGEGMGTPWDERFSSYVGHSMIRAHSSYIVVCPWFDVPALSSRTEGFYSDLFLKKTEKTPLPKGDYHSIFDIKLNQKKVTCSQSFKIY
jgi:hypothetical protein